MGQPDTLELEKNKFKDFKIFLSLSSFVLYFQLFLCRAFSIVTVLELTTVFRAFAFGNFLVELWSDRRCVNNGGR